MNEIQPLNDVIQRVGWQILLEAVLIVAVGWALIRVSGWLLPLLAERVAGGRRLRVLAMVPIVRLVAIVVTTVFVVRLFLPPTPEGLLALLGASGIALGFALKDYASSLIAGVVTLIEQPYRPGDWVRIGEFYGEVVEIGLRTVKLVTPDDDTIVVPHQRMWTNEVVNANAGARELQCSADFYVAADHDPRGVRTALHDIALCCPLTQLRLPVVVVVREQPWGTHYRLKAYPVDARLQFRFVTELTVSGKQALRELDVPLPRLPAVA